MGRVPIPGVCPCQEGRELADIFDRSHAAGADRRHDELARARFERAAREVTEAAAADPTPERYGGSDAGGTATLDAILDAVPEAILVFDASARIDDCNRAAERLLSRPPEQLLGADFVELLFPERLRGAMRGVIEARGAGWAGASQRAIEVMLLNGEGTEVPAELTLAWAAETGRFAAHLRDNREHGERERELAADARRRTRLLDLGQTALAEPGVERLIIRALATAGDEVNLTSCEIWDYESDAGELVLRRSTGSAIAVGAHVRPAPGSRLAQALSDRDGGVLVGDRMLPSPWLAPQDFQESTPAVIAAVLLGADGVLGAVTGGAEVGRRFSNADTTFFASIAQILASAIERGRVTDSLKSAESRLRTLVESLPAITYRAGLGAEGSWEYISPQVEEIIGLSPEECVADPSWWEKRIHPGDIDRVIAAEERAAAELEPLDVEYRITAENGRTLWIRDRASVGARGPEGEVLAEGLMSDVTAQKAAEVKLRHLADHDHLTDLFNRRGFETAVDAELATMLAGDTAALAIIDLDHLKLINDSHGHAAGDSLLKEVAAAVRLSLRDGDVLGRLSGDEFGLFIPRIEGAAARRRLGELIDLVRVSRRGGPSVTASAGAIMIDESERMAAADLLIHADLALYEAKEQGRDRVAFSDAEHTGHPGWLTEVRTAIEERRLALFAQPIFDLRTGEQHASELLVRLIDRRGRAISAGQFIPTAERFGLITEIDHWVLAHAVDAAATGMRVSVNLSAASIADDALTEMVGERLKATGADPARLTFEITETVATPAIELLEGFAARVEVLGCGLSLDDVGTGFGTLTYLQNLNFSQLKIDMTFVQRMLESPTDLGIVRSLVTIARELDLLTIAEGVESAETAEELRRLGVNYAQGYFLGEPAHLETTRA
jgi:diguanylate cyclase (GGDEF)-like protein/PAS domain S-box-containing protein